MSAAPAPAPIRTAPIALWHVAEAFLHTLYNLFGAPEDVARKHTLVGAEHGLIASWLRCAEALLRRLLLIEASAYRKPNTPPLLHPKRLRVRKPMGFDAEHPEKWRVSFRCFAGAPRTRRSAPRRARQVGGDGAKRVSFHSAWPLAERYEALIRVFNDPTQYARRLARRLHGVPHRLSEILRAPPEAVHRVERFAACGEAGAEAWRPFFSTG